MVASAGAHMDALSGGIMLKLYGYFRSGAAYRTRIAINLKGLDYEQQSIHLTKDGGAQFSDDYGALNPQNLVPTLIDGDAVIIQSMAIMEYLEDAYPDPSLLPEGAAARARVRGLANIVACDIHPVNNLRVRLYLVDEMGVSRDDQKIWIANWITLGFNAYEELLGNEASGRFSHGDMPGMADACLIPQIANARLNEVDIDRFPRILAIDAAAKEHAAFDAALPANQPDAE
jgi:maleylacetoacetate isomerase